mgnify:CR=1 FL=1
MKTDKWLYFRNIGTVGGDDGIVGTNYGTPTSGCYPASRIMNMHPTDDTTLRVCLKPVKFIDNGAQYNTAHGYHACDFVDINLNANNKHKEVMDAINSAMTNSRTPFIVVGDDVTGEYIHDSISSMENIANHRFQPGEGMHEYFEVIATSTSADADNKSAAQLDIKLPAQAILIESALTVRTISGHNNGEVRLDYHSASVADGASADGTGDGVSARKEWVGADASGNTSIPDANLDAGASSGTLNSNVHSGTAAPVHRAGNETYFQVVACEDLSNASFYVGVYLKWFGSGGKISY